MVPVSAEALDQLRQDYPTEVGFNRTLLPRFGLVSQDVTEEKKVNGKKQIEVIYEAGTFFVEKQGDEEEEVEVDGKMVKRKKWNRTELGTSAEGVIVFQRKQLKHFDEDANQGKGEYTSSPVYDTDDEVIPLFLNKKEIARGTPAELKAKYPGTHKTTGKPISLLEDNRILYVLLKTEEDEEGTIFQLNLRGSSMYSFLTYQRSTLPPSVLTKFDSEFNEKGSIAWNKMTFEAIRPLGQKEVDDVIARVNDIKEGIAAEKASYAAAAPSEEQQESRKQADKDFDSLGDGKPKKKQQF